MKSSSEQRMEKAEMRMVRWMRRVSLHERKKNKVLLQSMGLMGVAQVMRMNRLRWFGHVARRKATHWLQRALNFPVTGRRPRGRPRNTWKEAIEEDAKTSGVGRVDPTDRKAWQMTSLTQRAPRALNSAVVNFTQAFPKPAVEGALAPCIVHSEASSVQYDLVSKVAKEALVNDHRAYLLRSLLVCPDLVWSEMVSGFVQNLLDMKLELDSSLLGLLCASLGQNGTSQSKCKRFAKLLLAVINKCNTQMTPDHVIHLQRSVEVNQTFLKKACQLALKKIKT
eukprot:XP_003729256.2 PREDICTED: Fanconi anemia group E protein-like [Strongylocentrotus purpuratus]